MAAIKTQNFGGMVPAVNSRSLPPNAAVDVVNARIHEGKITPIQQLSEQHSFPPYKGFNSAVRIPDPLAPDGTGFTWLGGTSMNFSFSRPAINDDKYERYVYCNGDYLLPLQPRYSTLEDIRNGVVDYQLGVVQPTFIPSLTVSGGAVPSASTATVVQANALPGLGYNVGDTLTMVGGDVTVPMVVKVDQVDDAATGRIISVVIVDGGRYVSTPANPVYTTTSGGGAGAAFSVTWGAQGGLSAAPDNQGSNFAVGDTIQLAGGSPTQACTLEVSTLAVAVLADGTLPASGPIETVFVLVPGVYPSSVPSSPVAIDTTSGSGALATFYMTFSGAQGLTAQVYNTGFVGGTDYAVGDTVVIDGGTPQTAGTQAVLTIAAVNAGGVATQVYVSAPGAYIALPPTPSTQLSTSGAGSGAQFNIAWTVEEVVNATVETPGTGYVVGDVLAPVGGTFTQQARFTVATVDSAGGIATVTVSTAGAYTVYPASPVAVAGTTAGTGATLNIVWGNQNPTLTRAYVCTYVDIFGQESAPTDGAIGTGEADGSWLLGGFRLPLTNPGAPIMATNIYRTIATSATSATYYFVGTVPVSGAQSGVISEAGSGYRVGDQITVANGTSQVAAVLDVLTVSITGGVLTLDVAVPGLYTDFPPPVAVQASTTGTGLGATFALVWASSPASFLDTTDDATVALSAPQLLTVGWIPPLAMEGFIPVANGFLCGWAGNQVYFSEPGAPWAWPLEYQQSVDAQIVGMGFLDGSIIVLTVSSPFQLTGTTPSSMTNVKISTISPCTSRGSISQAIDGVDFATRNGIMNSSPYGFVNVSDKVVSSETWRQTYFSDIIAGARYEDTYLGLVGPGEGYILALQGYEGGYFMNPQNVRIALSRFLLPQKVTNMMQDPFSSAIFMIANGTVFLWDDPEAGTMVARWKSKEFAQSMPLNYAAYLCALDISTAGPQNNDEPMVGTNTGNVPVDQPNFEEFVAMGGETSIIGYCIIGAFVINAGVAAGTVPPGMEGGPNPPQFPFWPGLPTLSAGTGGPGPGGSGDPDWLVPPTLPPGASAFVEVYSNRTTVYSGEVNSDAQTRLPSGFKSTLWQYSITTVVPVWSFAMATSAKELRSAQ